MARQRIDGAWVVQLLVICALAACGDDSAAADTAVVDTIGGMEVSTEAQDIAVADTANPQTSIDSIDSGDGVAEPIPDDGVASVDTAALTDVGVPLPLDEVLRVNHIQAKGTHNSYHLSSTLSAAVPEWKFDQPPLDEQLDKHGVRQVELDVHYNGNGEFTIFHVPTLDAKSTCPTLRACLKLMKAWSDQHPKHHLLSILIEPKDDLDVKKVKGHYDELDAAILSVWPKQRLMRPDDVRGAHPTLRKALEIDGWPTIAATRGKAMFLMLDNGAHRTAYLQGHPTLENRVIFVRGGSTEPWAAAVEHNDPVGSKTTIEMAAKAGFLVRSDADDAKKSKSDNFAKAKAALLTGAHHISSDFPVAPKDGSYGFVLTGGNPSRCNPVTAPPSCTAEAIESL